MERFLKSKYKIGEKIGENPFSITYKGTTLTGEKPVVVKIYKRGVLNSSLIKQIKRKVRTLCDLSHPNIAKLYDGDYGWQGFYFVREYISGESLAEVLEKEKPMPIDRARKIAMSLCEALRLAHENNIIHGALNPNNVFLSSDGLVKLADFVIDGELRSSSKETSEFLIEGEIYLSPEEISGEAAKKPSDIYRLGILLYYMLTGLPPFFQEGKLEVALGHLRKSVTKPSLIRKDVPVYLDEIILKALEKDPLLRFNTVSEILASLKAKVLVKTTTAVEIPEISLEGVVLEAEQKVEVKKPPSPLRTWWPFRF